MKIRVTSKAFSENPEYTDEFDSKDRPLPGIGHRYDLGFRPVPKVIEVFHLQNEIIVVTE